VPREARSPRPVRSDAALVRAAQRGSEEAFAELFRRHWPMAYRAAWLVARDAAAAEDIAQEAFLAAVRALHRFDRRRPLEPWLHRIVVNRAIDHARARTARREVHDPGGADAAAHEVADVSAPLVEALAGLAPDHRAVVVLRHLLGYTPSEIAGLLDIPRGTVNSRLRRALDALAPVLEDGEAS
jgi:RNA polymerase sigma-70 factor (ECF subfamily)